MAADEEITVEARGFSCPIPTLRLQRAVDRAPSGSVLRLLADDPMARIDAPHYALLAGLEVIGVEAVGETIEIRVKKPV